MGRNFYTHEGDLVATPKWVPYDAIALTTTEPKFRVRIIAKSDIISIDGQEYKGLVDKYSGQGRDIRLKNDKGEITYTNNYFEPKEFKLLGKNGEQIQDPL